MALARPHRLRAQKDIRRVVQGGKTVQGSFFVMKTQATNRATFRATVIIGSGVARNAVDRNRMRRALQAPIGRALASHQGIDLVCIVRRRFSWDEAQQQEIQRALTRIRS